MSESPRPSGPPPSTSGKSTKAKRSYSARQVLAAILVVLIVIFIAENDETVHIRLIAGSKVSAPVFVALIISAVAGALIALLVLYRQRKK